MAEIRPSEISEILKNEIKGFEGSISIRETGRVLSCGDGIARIYGLQNAALGELLDQKMGRERATLTFAIQPSDAEVARVVGGLETIAKLKIIPTVKVDAALLGGVTAELGGKIYDGSLATRLAEAKRRLAG